MPRNIDRRNMLSRVSYNLPEFDCADKYKYNSARADVSRRVASRLTEANHGSPQRSTLKTIAELTIDAHAVLSFIH
jgi:hypothetical protein